MEIAFCENTAQIQIKQQVNVSSFPSIKAHSDAAHSSRQTVKQPFELCSSYQAILCSKMGEGKLPLSHSLSIFVLFVPTLSKFILN